MKFGEKKAYNKEKVNINKTSYEKEKNGYDQEKININKTNYFCNIIMSKSYLKKIKHKHLFHSQHLK